MEEIAQTIHSTILTGLFIFMWWDIRRRDTLTNDRISKKLYREDGKEIYMREDACQKEQQTKTQLMNASLQVIHVEIKHLRADIKNSNEQRENARKEIIHMFKELKKT